MDPQEAKSQKQKLPTQKTGDRYKSKNRNAEKFCRGLIVPCLSER